MRNYPEWSVAFWAATAAGANALFMEIHPQPKKALCDAESMLPIDQVQPLVQVCQKIFNTIRNPS